MSIQHNVILRDLPPTKARSDWGNLFGIRVEGVVGQSGKLCYCYSLCVIKDTHTDQRDCSLLLNPTVQC